MGRAGGGWVGSALPSKFPALLEFNRGGAWWSGCDHQPRESLGWTGLGWGLDRSGKIGFPRFLTHCGDGASGGQITVRLGIWDPDSMIIILYTDLRIPYSARYLGTKMDRGRVGCFIRPVIVRNENQGGREYV